MRLLPILSNFPLYRVRDGGGKASRTHPRIAINRTFHTDSDTYQKCRAEVEEISRHTLFTPVARQEAVQAMVLVSGWSSNGWLPGGHAVRMGLEIGKCGDVCFTIVLCGINAVCLFIGMHKAWPRLYKRMRAGKMSVSQEERQLVISARTWFVLFLFEHQ